MECDLNCEYCWQHTKKIPYLITSKQNDNSKEIFSIIRRSSPYILVTGGDPFMHPDIEELLKYAKKTLKFNRVYLISKGSHLHKFENLLDYVDYLYVSLDSIRVREYAQRLGVGTAVVQQIIDNTVRCSQLQKKYNFRLSINMVVDADHLEEAHEIVDFCSENNIRLGFHPRRIFAKGTYDKRLINNTLYLSFIEKIKRLKKLNRLRSHGDAYLETIKYFKPFKCNPILFMPIMPNGDLIYPCSVIGKVAGNVLQSGSCEETLRTGIKKFGSIKDFKKNSPICKDECYCVSYTIPSLFLDNPLNAINWLFRSRLTVGSD